MCLQLYAVIVDFLCFLDVFQLKTSDGLQYPVGKPGESHMSMVGSRGKYLVSHPPPVFLLPWLFRLGLKNRVKNRYIGTKTTPLLVFTNKVGLIVHMY